MNGCQEHGSNSMVRFAVRTIREHACDGLRAIDVVRQMHCSRRLAELRFREMTGLSILGAIRNIRFDKARWLLANTKATVASIANRCGYTSVPTFCREFRKETDVTPEAWRQKA